MLKITYGTQGRFYNSKFVPTNTKIPPLNSTELRTKAEKKENDFGLLQLFFPGYGRFKLLYRLITTITNSDWYRRGMGRPVWACQSLQEQVGGQTEKWGKMWG